MAFSPSATTGANSDTSKSFDRNQEILESTKTEGSTKSQLQVSEFQNEQAKEDGIIFVQGKFCDSGRW